MGVSLLSQKELSPKVGTPMWVKRKSPRLAPFRRAHGGAGPGPLGPWRVFNGDSRPVYSDRLKA